MTTESIMYALGRSLRARDWKGVATSLSSPATTVVGWIVISAVVVAIGSATVWFMSLVDYHSTWEWWFNAYFVVGGILGALGTLVAFIVAWIWCVDEARFWGFALGWFPSAIAAGLFGALLIFLWLPALVVLGVRKR